MTPQRGRRAEFKAEPTGYSEYQFIFEGAVGSAGVLRYRGPLGGDWQLVSLVVDDSAFWLRAIPHVPSVVADLVDLTAAIYAADRLSPQRLEHSVRRIYLTVPLREPEAISAAALAQLRELLAWTTASEWEIHLVQHSAARRPVELESLLLPLAPDDAEVVLWSGGLDALAGVYSRLRSEPGLPIILLGSGGNDRVLGKQQHLLKHLERIFPGRLYSHRIPLRLRGIHGLPQDRLMRGRGVVFTLLGLMSSYMLRRYHLSVHENGIGAINLPFRESSVGLDHVRSVHPFTLERVSAFVSTVLGEAFRVDNPSLLTTKAQMLLPMAEDGRAGLVANTESCDSYQRKRPGQCGYCSSCLLRRQAVLASGLKDYTKYVIPDGDPPKRDPSTPIRAMLNQVEVFRSAFGGATPSADSWEKLTRFYPALDDIVDRSASYRGLTAGGMRQRIIEMYLSYVREWDLTRDQLVKGVLDWQPPAGETRSMAPVQV